MSVETCILVVLKWSMFVYTSDPLFEADLEAFPFGRCDLSADVALAPASRIMHGTPASRIMHGTPAAVLYDSTDTGVMAFIAVSTYEGARWYVFVSVCVNIFHHTHTFMHIIHIHTCIPTICVYMYMLMYVYSHRCIHNT